MQLGVGNEELEIEGDMADCRARHEDGNTHSAGICAVCGRYGLYDRIGFIVFSRHKNTK